MIADAEKQFYGELLSFQITRLKGTYADFVADEELSRITDYFFGQIYSTADKRKRDDAFNKIYAKMVNTIGYKAAYRATQLKDLNEITDTLDLGMVKLHREKFPGETISAETYEVCYGDESLQDKRQAQIELLVETTRFFHKLAHFPMIQLVIKPTKLAAKALGVEYIMTFFMEGYDAFRSVKDASPFFNAMQEREFSYLRMCRERNKNYEKKS